MIKFEYGSIATNTTAAVSGTSQTNTASISPVNVSSTGPYTCKVTVIASGVCEEGGSEPNCPTKTSNAFSLTVQFPNSLISSVSLSSATPTVTVGNSVTLTCNATLTTNVFGAMVKFEYGSKATNSIAAISGTSQTNTATISPVNVSSTGPYTCKVTVIASGVCEDGGSEPNCPTKTSNTISLTVQFPSTLIISATLSPANPTLSPANPTVTIGDAVTLTCTVTLSTDVSGAMVKFEYGSIATNTITAVSGNTQTDTASISPVSISSAGEYTCTVTVTALGVCEEGGPEPACPTDTSNTVSLRVLSITPNSLTRLDIIPPYNTFNLSCSLSIPIGSNVPLSFSWTEDLVSIPANTDLSTSMNISQSNESTVTRVLSVTLKKVTPGTTPNYTYVCKAGVTGNNLATVNATVFVKGSAPPEEPQLGTVGMFPTKAVIPFTISSVAYDPENYTVKLGTNAAALTTVNDASDQTDPTGLTFLTAMGLMYTIAVDGLSTNQMYYYQIVSTNSNSSVSSAIDNFMTDQAPPGPPSSPSLTISTSTSLYFSWGEPEERNGEITGYSYTCYNVTSTESIVIQQDTDLGADAMSVIIDGDGSGLDPYTNYTCEVTAFTEPGEGAAAFASAISAQAAPSGPPLDFTFVPTDPTMLILSWNLPQESLQNGMIIGYEYMCADVPGGPQSTSMLNATVTGLTPFTNYTCSVKAATINGTGPADTIVATTAQDVPGPVNSLDVIGENSTSFKVSWKSPISSQKNGIVSSYYLVASFVSNGTFARDMRLNVYEGVEEDIDYKESFSGLVRYVPYNVTVFAATSAGNGTKVSETDFTEQGTPGPVTIVSVVRTSSSHMTVEWTPLTLEEARGFLTGYIVRATPAMNSRKRQDATVISKQFPSDASSGTLTTLEEGVAYGVTVTASTSEGEGEASESMTVDPVPGGVNVAALVIAICTIVTVAILVVIIILLFICYRSQRTGKLHTLTVEANPEALKDFTSGTKNGTNIELKGLEKMEEALDQHSQPIPVDGFAAHVGSLHARRDLGFEEEYSSFKSIPQGPYMVSKLPHNTMKNRFDNVFPFDEARVELTPVNGEVGSDYINASWMDGYRKEKAFIAAQGPLEKTVVDFWRMIWEFQLPTVIMLTELVERSVEKCSCYWPKSMNQTMDVGMGLKVTLIEQRAYVEYKLKKIILFNSAEKDGGKLEVTHYHFTAWPDHGVPADKTCMLAFIKRIRKAHLPIGPPLLVHCSAGVGRTGTFITLDTMLQRMEDGQDLNVYEFVKQMRTKRVLMVQTEAQYMYIHDALAEYIICGDTSIEASNASVFKRMEELERVTDHKTGYQCQFELLGEISIKVSDGLCSEALHVRNVEKNRYKQSLSSLPFNYNRVRLKTMTGSGDYINASVVDGYKHRGAFLATQAPLETTVEDFWRMVWENQSMAIVMLYDVNESSEPERKFSQYWPTNPGEEKTYGKVLVKLTSEKEQAHYTLRKMELRMENTYVNLAAGGDKGDRFTVTHYQYRKWPETGKPSEPSQVLRLIENLVKTQSNTGNKAITVMCSDGIGRTGAFICIYSVLERVKTEAVADIFQFIKSSRFQRAGLVKELDQYVFCHEMLQEFLSTFDNYSNFEVKR